MSDADLNAVPASADTPVGSTAGAGPMMGMSPAAGPYARPSVNNVLRVAPRRFTIAAPSSWGVAVFRLYCMALPVPSRMSVDGLSPFREEADG